MKKEKLTIVEIAQLSGVSVSTVSRVLNNHPSVSQKTRDTVSNVIEQNGFTPSMFARGMINKSSRTIALIVPDITNPYFISLIAEIENSIHDFGYSIMLMNTMTAGPTKRKNSVKEEIEVFNTVDSKQVDGVIVLGGEIDLVDPHPTYIARLNKLAKSRPVIVVGQTVSSVNCTFIERDLIKGVNLLMLHLLSLGYKNIALVGGEDDVTIYEERKKTYLQTLELYNADAKPIIYSGDFYAKDGYDAMNLILENNVNVDAIVAINDVVASGVIRACLDAKLLCPQDIAVVSCDMFLDHKYHIPRLTTINQHNDYLGHIAVHQLLALITQEPYSHRSLHSPELVIGESCGALK